MNRRLLRVVSIGAYLALAGLFAVGTSGCEGESKKPAPQKVTPAPKASRPAPPKAATPPPAAAKTRTVGTPTAEANSEKPATVAGTANVAGSQVGGGSPSTAAPVAKPAPKKTPPAAPTKPAPKISKMTPPPGPNQPIPAPADVAAPNTDAKTTKSGLAYYVQREGTGKVHPTANSTVEVHYTGWTTDGKMFDSSVARGETIKFPLNQVIPGWTEGVQLMKVGEITRFWIPEALAYAGRPGAPAGMLVFDVELIGIQEPPKAPADVAKPPADAKKTASGIAYKVLKAGTGKVKPKPTDTVEVHYSGWTTDGKMFDSSVVRGETAKFPLNRVIKGWTEGLGLMVEGEKTLLWIPEALAYGGRPGAPQGMLVFEVELLKINP